MSQSTLSHIHYKQGLVNVVTPFTVCVSARQNYRDLFDGGSYLFHAMVTTRARCADCDNDESFSLWWTSLTYVIVSHFTDSDILLVWPSWCYDTFPCVTLVELRVILVTYSHKPSVAFCCCSFGDMHARYDSSDFGDTCQQQLCCLPLSHVSSVAVASPLPPIQSSTSCTELPPTTPAMSHPKDQVWEFKLCLLLIFRTLLCWQT